MLSNRVLCPGLRAQLLQTFSWGSWKFIRTSNVKWLPKKCPHKGWSGKSKSKRGIMLLASPGVTSTKEANFLGGEVFSFPVNFRFYPRKGRSSERGSIYILEKKKRRRMAICIRWLIQIIRQSHAVVATQNEVGSWDFVFLSLKYLDDLFLKVLFGSILFGCLNYLDNW